MCEDYIGKYQNIYFDNFFSTTKQTNMLLGKINVLWGSLS
jgi:hypothetical protein